MVLSGGGNFFLYNALFLQVPYFQQHQPEGLCLATWMIVSANIAVPLVYCFYLLDRYVYTLSLDVTLLVMMAISTTAAIALSFTYSMSLNNTSWPILIAAFLSGIVGYMCFQVTYPVLSRFVEKYAIAARSDVLTVFLSVIVFFQNPGSPSIGFTPRTFLFVLGIFLLIFPPLAYVYVSIYKVGLKDSVENATEVEMTDTNREMEPIIEKANASVDFTFEIFSVCWVEVHVYGIVVILLPFIFDRNSSNIEEGSIYLSYALNLTCVMNVMGQFLVYWYQMPTRFTLAVFTTCLFLLYLSLVVNWFYGLSSLLLVLYCVVTFSSQYLMACIWSSVFALPVEHRNRIAKLVGAWDSVCVFFGSLTGLFISSTAFNCFP